MREKQNLTKHHKTVQVIGLFAGIFGGVILVRPNGSSKIHNNKPGCSIFFIIQCVVLKDPC
jgi:hypothetical protein